MTVQWRYYGVNSVQRGIPTDAVTVKLEILSEEVISAIQINAKREVDAHADAVRIKGIRIR